MYSLICVLLPSVLSIILDHIVLKNKYDIDSFLNYCVYCLVNNLIMIAIFVIVFNTEYDVFKAINLYPLMTIKYGIIAIIISVILSFIHIIIKKNVGIDLEIKKK